MTRPRIFFPGRQILLVILASVTVLPTHAKPAAENEASASAVAPAGMEDIVAQLGAEVKEIAGSALISRAKKEKRISTAVRVAVVTATAYQKDPAAALALAIELAQTAARAAPAFAEVVANAVSFAPAISRLEGASSKIRLATFAAAKNKSDGKTGRPRQAAPGPERTVHPEENAVAAVSAPAAARTRKTEPPRVLEEPAEAPGPASPLVATSSSPRMGNNTDIHLTAGLEVRHDDNIFVTADNEVGDTILTLTPGVMFRYGLESLAHGSLNYNQAFIWYAHDSAPKVSLADAATDFGYNNGNLNVAAHARFEQLNQNTNVTAGSGLEPQLFRRDVLDLGLDVETDLTAKTRIRTGLKLNQEEYKTAGLVGTRETEIPLNVYLATTPKTDASLGVTYRKVTPQGEGPSGHDLYYNVGARGSFTPKLSGEFSVGYRTRTVDVNPQEDLWGFHGNLNYEATSKTSLALQLSRDFSTGALGESLSTNNYTLRLTADPTLQWSFGATLSYQTSDFGPTVFSENDVPVTVIRTDDYWEGSLFASYVFRSWLTAYADYTLRKNQSTRPDAQYSNNLFSLSLGMRY